MADVFNFNLKKAEIYQAIKWSKNPFFRFVKPLKKLFFALFVIFFLVFIYNLELPNLGFSMVFFVLSLSFKIKEFFFNSKFKNPRIKSINEALKASETFNLADFLSFESARAVYRSMQFARKHNLSEINSDVLFYFLIEKNPELNFIFSRLLINIKDLKKILKISLENLKKNAGIKKQEMIFSEDLQKSLIESLKIAGKNKHLRVEAEDIIAGLAVHNLIFKKILIDFNLKFEDVKNLSQWLEKLTKIVEERKKFWEWKNLIKRGSLAKEWAAGYTITLDPFSTDLSKEVRRKAFSEVVGHKKEIKAMERILARKEKNNVLIVGEAGSGRKSMVYALAEKSASGESLPEINYKRVIQLDLSALMSQISSTEETEFILDNIFKEVISAGNVILVIDEIHNFIGGSARLGAIDISGILTPYLAYPSFQIVALTTFEGLHKNIEQNTSILSLLEKVEVSEISEEETLMLLQDLALKLEYKYKKFISYSSLRDIIVYCSRYMQAIPFPEKAMSLLDEAMAYLSQTKEKVLLSKHIARIVSEKTEIPVGDIAKKEKQVLLNLEPLIHEIIINQEEAVKEISTALRRARAGVAAKTGPMGAFLFLGPTGVGKTETCKALAEIYFGSKEKMIRLDMSEFQNTADISRLLGSTNEEGLLTTEVREKPFSLILLDEIEKAHPNVLNLFLQVLDEGHLTDGMGRKVDFKSSIIIATSNAGYQMILKALKEKTEWFKVKEILLDYLFAENIFRPEFINRFDAMVVFKPLSKENLLDIAELMLKKINKNLKEKEVELVVTKELKEKIVELGYNPTFGAREMKRVIQDKVENILASALLSGEIKRGSKIEINTEDFSLIIK